MAGYDSESWELLSEMFTLDGTSIKTTAMFVGTGALVHVVSVHEDGQIIENLEFVPGVEISYLEEYDELGNTIITGRELAPIEAEYEDLD